MSDETRTTRGETEAEPGREGMSRRTALGYSGALAAGVAAASLVPDSAAAAESGTQGSRRIRSISLDQANRIVAAAVAYVRRHSDLPPMFVYVVDACGEEKASRRMDGNPPASVSLVPAKARTARAFRTPTAVLAQNVTEPARIASFTAAGFSLLGGGHPIVENGDEVIGAIGVGGGSAEEDDRVALAALRAL